MTLLQKKEGELSESLMSQENTLASRETEHETHVTMLEAELKQAAADKMKLQHRLQQALDKEGIIQSIFYILYKRLSYLILPCPIGRTIYNAKFGFISMTT